MSVELSILTLFPDFFRSPFATGVIDGAIERGLLSVNTINIRDYSLNKHKKCDDYPYGGGPGMLMSTPPFEEYYRRKPKARQAHTVLLTPSGRKLTQAKVKELSSKERLCFICGHYEGVDARIEREYADELISIGDYVLSGGEHAALVLTDAISRYLGVLGNDESAENDSFETGSDGLLEYEQYTRPVEAFGIEVDPNLRGGNHKVIERLRRRSSLIRTFTMRPDLFAKADLTGEDVETIFDYLKSKGEENG